MARSYPSDLLAALRASEQRAKLVVVLAGTAGTWRWCTGIMPVRCDLDGDAMDEAYIPRAMRPGPIDLQAPGRLTKLQIDDTDGIIASEMLAGGLTNRDITVGVLLREGESWIDPFVVASGTVGELSLRDGVASLTVVSDAGWRNKSGAAPCQISCVLNFRGARCQYAGSDTTCNRTWTDCTSKSNTANFRGFRRLPSAGQSIRFAKTSVVLVQPRYSGFPDVRDSAGPRVLFPRHRALPAGDDGGGVHRARPRGGR